MRIFLDGIMFSKEREGGISRLYREMVPLIAELDPSVSFLLYVRRKVKAAHLPDSKRMTYVHEPSLNPWRWFFGKAKVQSAFLQRAYLRAKPDIFHSTFFTIPNSVCTPYVVTVHDMIDELYVEVTDRLRLWEQIKLKAKCITSADLIISVSNCTKNDILKFHDIDAKRIVTVYHGVSPQFKVIDDEGKKQDFLRRYALSRPFFLYVGRRSYVKNFMGMLKAYTEFWFRNEIDLVVVGGEEELRPWELDLIVKKSLVTHVKHIKWLSDEDLVLAYNTAQAFVYPSFYEGFGLPILEAMACGTPVIASKTSSIPEVAGDAVLFFNPQEEGEIVRAMNDVLESDTAKALAYKGRERAKLFNWHETARQVLKAYRQLV